VTTYGLRGKEYVVFTGFGGKRSTFGARGVVITPACSGQPLDQSMCRSVAKPWRSVHVCCLSNHDPARTDASAFLAPWPRPSGMRAPWELSGVGTFPFFIALLPQIAAIRASNAESLSDLLELGGVFCGERTMEKHVS
jgi:hypothetical protein